MRIVFFGSAAFAVPALEKLNATEGIEVAAVFTQPDRPAGRGRASAFTAVKSAALALGLPVLQPEELDADALAKLRHFAPDAVAIIAYGKLIPPEFLPAAPRGWLNLHPSLLPRYRGAAPVPHCILNGDAETGVTIFRLNEKFDQGDILAVKKIPVPPDATGATLLDDLAPLGAALLAQVLLAEKWEFLPQSGEKSSYARKFAKADGEIDWRLPALAIDRRVRAYQPWPLAYTYYGDRRLTLTKIAVTDRPATAALATALPATALPATALPATVVIDKNEFYVATADKLVKIITVIPEGKAAMTGAEFLRGARLKSGERLTVRD
ncbi:methionyl-tRNA formyltransferase [Planctomycetales bacterium]|nr:methionyl-tRNA formyltransferase [Planctomycetales bacterium]